LRKCAKKEKKNQRNKSVPEPGAIKNPKKDPEKKMFEKNNSVREKKSKIVPLLRPRAIQIRKKIQLQFFSQLLANQNANQNAHPKCKMRTVFQNWN
jgi:hypothetical protein